MADSDVKKILFMVLGTSPAVLTETVWKLARGARPFIPDEVIVLTTEAGRQRILPVVKREAGDPWGELVSTFGLRGAKEKLLPDGVPNIRIVPICDSRATCLQDLVSVGDNLVAADTIVRELRAVTDETARTEVCMSIAGGRKTMGDMLLSCAMLFGRQQDRVLHVTASSVFSSPNLRRQDCPDLPFWFPNGHTYVMTDGHGHIKTATDGTVKSYSDQDADIRLVEVPYVRIRSEIRDCLRSAISYADLVKSAGERLRCRCRPRVRLDLRNETARLFIEGREPISLKPKEALLTFMLFSLRRVTSSAYRECIREAVGGAFDGVVCVGGSVQDKESTDKQLDKAYRDTMSALRGYAAGCYPEVTERLFPMEKDKAVTVTYPEELMSVDWPKGENSKALKAYFSGKEGCSASVQGTDVGTVGRMPGRTSARHLLIAVMGGSPAVLTETLWAMADDTDRPMPDGIMVFTTHYGAEAMQKQLNTASADGGATVWEMLSEALNRHGKALIPYKDVQVRVFKDRDESILDDLDSGERTLAAADLMLKAVSAKMAAHLEATVSFSIAGGRKTMSSLLFACAMFTGKPGDRVLHVLVEPPFGDVQPLLAEKGNGRPFYFPSEAKYVPRGGAASVPAVSGTEANLSLFEVPFVRLREAYALQTAAKESGSLSYEQLVKAFEKRFTYDTLPYVTLTLGKEIILRTDGCNPIGLSAKTGLLLFQVLQAGTLDAEKIKSFCKAFAFPREVYVNDRVKWGIRRSSAEEGYDEEYRWVVKAVQELRTRLETKELRALGADLSELRATLRDTWGWEDRVCLRLIPDLRHRVDYDPSKITISYVKGIYDFESLFRAICIEWKIKTMKYMKA